MIWYTSMEVTLISLPGMTSSNLPGQTVTNAVTSERTLTLTLHATCESSTQLVREMHATCERWLVVTLALLESQHAVRDTML